MSPEKGVMSRVEQLREYLPSVYDTVSADGSKAGLERDLTRKEAEELGVAYCGEENEAGAPIFKLLTCELLMLEYLASHDGSELYYLDTCELTERPRGRR